MTNILVIEDERAISLLLTKGLAKFGFNVATAMDGLEGIKKFDEGHYDLVITDLCMPGLDGNGVLKHVRISQRPFTPVIGMSGKHWLIEHNDFDALLAKPFSIKNLVNTVNRLRISTLGMFALG